MSHYFCYTADDKVEAAAAVTTETVSRDPTPKVNDWRTSDVGNWLQTNHLGHLQTWYIRCDSFAMFEVCIYLNCRFDLF